MSGEPTVADVLERARKRRRRKRCPEPGCDGVVSIRGLGGEYRWECLECDAVGFGYATRSAAFDGIQRARRD